MSAISIFQKVTKVLNELSTAAVSARSEVQKLLTVLDGPAVNDVNVSNIQNKSPPQPGTLTDPPHEYIPPIGASMNTWPNIIKNKENIDFCSGEFNLTNRIHCGIRKNSGPQLI